jgi:hypothetical protein
VRWYTYPWTVYSLAPYIPDAGQRVISVSIDLKSVILIEPGRTSAISADEYTIVISGQDRKIEVAYRNVVAIIDPSRTVYITKRTAYCEVLVGATSDVEDATVNSEYSRSITSRIDNTERNSDI